MRATITIMMRVRRIDQQYDGGGFVVILKSNSGETQYSPVNVHLEKMCWLPHSYNIYTKISMYVEEF